MTWFSFSPFTLTPLNQGSQTTGPWTSTQPRSYRLMCGYFEKLGSIRVLLLVRLRSIKNTEEEGSSLKASVASKKLGTPDPLMKLTFSCAKIFSIKSLDVRSLYTNDLSCNCFENGSTKD
ncbi:hypothetical protein XENORESO_007197 [Xenotaenia resolanae]|uniref:Uncharacterized protein n=1 Tax=Xenotaenia resolanae TaxID=208358 RepID=A0ABV0VXU0_9TELE